MSDPLGFGKYVPGFDFLQNLAKQAAGGVAQGVGNYHYHLACFG